MAGVFSKLKLTVGLVSILSMLVSSVSACACSHHSAPGAESKSSCHSHSGSGSEHEGRPVVADYKGHIISSTGCSCEQASPRLVFKQEQKQLQVKTAIAQSSVADPQFVVIAAKPAIENFATRTFSQSYLRTSSSGRAPPRPKSV